MRKGVRPRNATGRRHGYWEVYSHDNKLLYKSFYLNGKRVGYEELGYSHDTNKLIKKKYHI